LRPYESEPKPPKTWRSFTGQPKHGGCPRSGNRVGRFTGTDADSASHKRTGLKQAYKAGSGTVIRAPDQGNALIKNTSSGKVKPGKTATGYVRAVGNSGKHGA